MTIDLRLSKRPIYGAFAGLLTASIVGCAVPKPPSADTMLTSALPSTTAIPESFAADTNRMASVPAVDWIKSFNDPVLNSLIAEAMTNNLNLQAAASRLEASEALAKQAGARLLPVVRASGQSVNQNFSGSEASTTTEGALSISWELDIWGKLRAQNRAAQAQLNADIAEFEFAEMSLQAQVASAWFVAIEAHQQREYAQEMVDLLAKTTDIVKTKFEFGDLSQREVLLTEADLTSARERLRQTEGAYRTALRSVEVLLGRYPSAELETSSALPDVPRPVPAGIPAQLLERRPDLRAAALEVAAAFNLTTAAEAARLPSIGLSASVGGSSSALNDMLGLGSTFWNVGANFLGPIFQGGALKAAADARNAEQEAALALYGQRALNAFSEVENALDAENLLREREALIQSVYASNRDALELGELQFQEGAIELMDVLQMQTRLIEAGIARINIRNARLQSRIQLHLALGGSFTTSTPEN